MSFNKSKSTPPFSSSSTCPSSSFTCSSSGSINSTSNKFLKKRRWRSCKPELPSIYEPLYNLKEKIIILSLDILDNLTRHTANLAYTLVLDDRKKCESSKRVKLEDPMAHYQHFIEWNDLKTMKAPPDNMTCKDDIYQIVVIGHGRRYEESDPQLSKLISFIKYCNPKMVIFANCNSGSEITLPNYMYGECEYVSSKIPEHIVCIGFKNIIYTTCENPQDLTYYDKVTRHIVLSFSNAYHSFVPFDCLIMINGKLIDDLKDGKPALGNILQYISFRS